MYKGKYVYTITADDVKNPLKMARPFGFFEMKNTMGNLQPCDIGKQIYEQTSPSGHTFYQVENDEQLKRRLEGKAM